MRALFVVVPALMHALPVVPLAWALRAAGHEVVVLTADDGCAVGEAGLPVVDVAPDEDLLAQYGMPVVGQHPELAQQREPTEQDYGVVAGMLGSINRHLSDRVLDVARRWRPDLVVHEASAPVGALAAAVLDVPAVELDIRVDTWPRLREQVVAGMGDALDRHGVTELPTPGLRVTMTPPSLADVPAGWQPMRCTPYNGAGRLPDWLLEERSRPVLAVTMGAVGTALAPVSQIVAAATELDVEVVLALGDQDVSLLGELPPAVRSAGWVPMAQLLPHCAAVVHHGGSGTAFAALACGVPQLVVPAGTTHVATATTLADRGVARVATAAALDGSLLRSVLDDDALRSAASDVAKEITTVPSPAEVGLRCVELCSVDLVG